MRLCRLVAIELAIAGSAAGADAQITDPPLLMPEWSADCDQDDDWFGMSLASAGDVNGDGFGDVIIGDQGYDHGQVDEGVAWVYLGTADGLSPSPAWKAESDQADAAFGLRVAGAGDVDGDGFDDVLVLARHFSSGAVNEGAAFVWRGGPSGLGDDGTPANADWTVTGGGSNVQLSSGALADVNGDGFADAIVGSGFYSGEFPREISFQGLVRVYHGSALGLSTVPDEEAFGNQEEAFYGGAIERAGDVNADGFDDVFIGINLASFPTGEGWVTCRYGAPGGLYSGGSWSAHGGQANAGFGSSLGCAGDLNADGFDDVFVGATGYSSSPTTKGGVFVYYGGAAGLGPTATAADADWRAYGNLGQSSGFGSAAGPGDFDGDGYDDLAVGAYSYSGGQNFEGVLFAWHGGPSGPAPAIGHPGNAEARFESNQASAWLGAVVAAAGDVNGDGLRDALVTARLYDGAVPDGGRVYALHGGNPWTDLQSGLAGAAGIPRLLGLGSLQPLSPVELSLDDAAPSAQVVLIVGMSVLGAPLKGGVLVPDPGPPGLLLRLTTSAGGSFDLAATWPSGLPAGLTFVMQCWVVDPGGPAGYSASNGVLATVP